MILVRKIDEAWQPLAGTVVLTRMATSFVARFEDGREEERPCDPYPVETAPLSAERIAALVAEGVWGEAELAAYGLKVAEPFVAPEGKQRAGASLYVESKGVVHETYDLEDIPPPPPEPTAAEKLASIGLSKADLRALLSDD